MRFSPLVLLLFAMLGCDSGTQPAKIASAIALRVGRGDVKMWSDLGLERFQAQLTSTQMGNPGSMKLLTSIPLNRSQMYRLALFLIVAFSVFVADCVIPIRYVAADEQCVGIRRFFVGSRTVCCRPQPTCCTPSIDCATPQSRRVSPAIPQTVIRDLGTFHWHDAPKRWHIVLPHNTDKVEISFYMKGRDYVSLNAAFGGVVQINEKPAIGFRRKIATGYIFHNYINDQEFAEASTRGQFLDVTSLIVPGENEFLYYHYTRNPMGLKLRIRTR